MDRKPPILNENTPEVSQALSQDESRRLLEVELAEARKRLAGTPERFEYLRKRLEQKVQVLENEVFAKCDETPASGTEKQGARYGREAVNGREAKSTVRAVAHTKQTTNPLQRLLEELSGHIGLEEVKRNIEELANSIRIDQMRSSRGLKVADRSLHMVFYGNPGTGKTTIAGLVAKIYKELGVLTKGHLLSTDRAGLVANYVGQTATKVTSVVQQAIGGVLFVDEAYSLAPPDVRNDFGQEAIQQLLLLMENYRKELVVIVAGYPNEMERFLDANPGLNSRFTKRLHFADYSPEQLVQIFDKMCRENDYRLEDRAKGKLLQTVQAAHSHRDHSFGNARYVRNLFEEAIRNLATRLIKSGSADTSDLIAINEPDIPLPSTQEKPRSPENLADLGRYLASKGTAQNTKLLYPSWEMDTLQVITDGSYCTTRVQPLEGKLYCATFDFGNTVLTELLAAATERTQHFIAEGLIGDPFSTRTMKLPDPIEAGITATLGTLQQGLHDLFIPLVIAEVFGIRDRSAEKSTVENLPITVDDVRAVGTYCRHLAKSWWITEKRERAICDACASSVLRGAGFIADSNLYCEACFELMNEPDVALNNLREDRDYYGSGLLDKAKHFARLASFNSLNRRC